MRVTLMRPGVVSGKVVDAQTGQEISNYTIRCSSVWAEGDRPVWQSFDFLSNHIVKTGGKFTIKFADPSYRYLLRVQADEYLAEETPLFDPGGGTKEFEFRLHRGTPIEGKLVDRGGRAATGATVFLATSGEWINLENGNIEEGWENNCVHAKSDGDGHFSLPPQRDDFALIVLSDAGSATVKRSELTKGTAIRLKPWASVRGVILVDGKPARNISVYGNSGSISLGADSQIASWRYYFKTGGDGSFELPRVVGKLVLTREISNYKPQRSWYVNVATIDTLPGQSYDLAPDRGTTVSGQLTIPGGKQWMVRQAWLIPKGKAHEENFENVEVLPGGHFRADGIEEGTYDLHVALHEFPPDEDCGWGRLVGAYDKEVTIPAGQARVDVGVIAPDELPAPDLILGDKAPEFSLKSLSGKQIRLADLRGKSVLLVFWAGWCAPCIREIPDLQKIQSNYGSDGRFALVGLSQDETEDDLRRLVGRAKIGWTQAWVGVDSDVVKAYGATAIPATFVIGPDGKIVARDLKGEALEKAVAAALGK
jgi:peroxiredoxin